MKQQHLPEETSSFSLPAKQAKQMPDTALPPVAGSEVVSLEKQVTSPEEAVVARESALTSVRATDVEIDTELKRLRKQAQLSSWLGGIAWSIAVLAATVLVIGVFLVQYLPDLFYLGVMSVSTGGSTTMTLSGTLLLLVMVVCGLLGWLTHRKRMAMTRIASRFDDVRAVGPLIEALYFQDTALRSELTTTLTRLIPRMREEDGLRLDTNQRNLMNRYVSHYIGDDRTLPRTILQAYPTIGNGTEMTVVRNVAKGKGYAGKDPLSQQAAQDYLDIVEQRRQQETLNTTLLRASSALEIGVDTLLRSAQENASTPSNQLLRPSTTTRDEENH